MPGRWGLREINAAIRYLEEKRKGLEVQLRELESTLAGLEKIRDQNHHKRALSAIEQICEYLAQRDSPCSQNEIIRAVGGRRLAMYPTLKMHYGNVWKALEYHVRHDKLIRCVDPETFAPVPLKPLPERSYEAPVANVPELYEGDNWFALRKDP